MSRADPESDHARAAALFAEAKSDMDRREFASACSKLSKSEASDPQVGTLLNLAYCFEHVGKTATALSTWFEAATLAAGKNQPDREQFALMRAHDLEPRLFRVTIRVAQQAAYDQMVITLDGSPFDRSRWNLPLPMDSGEHELLAAAPGFTPWSTHFSVSGETGTSLWVPALAPLADPETRDATSPTSLVSFESQPNRTTMVAGKPSHSSPWPFIAAGVGVAALAVGTGFGVAALASEQDSNQSKNCLPNSNCSPEGVADRKLAVRDAIASDIGFGIAAAAGMTGIVLWLTADHGHTSSAHVSLQGAPGSAGVILSGRW